MTKKAWGFKPITIWALCLAGLLICFTAIYLPATKRQEKEKAYIGIELGATHTRVATFRAGKIDILPAEQTNQFSPPYIAFTNDGILFGEAAKIQAEIDPGNAVFGIRHLIGRNFSEIEAEIEQLPFKIISKAGQPFVEINLARGNKHFSPEELYGLILSRTKETAETYLGAEISMAVVTVPSTFNDNQREATKKAAGLAGLNIPRLLNEPSAAGIAHELDMSCDMKTYLVYGLDDDTLNLHIVEVDEGVLEILASTDDVALAAGVPHIGAQGVLDGSKIDEQDFGSMENLDTLNSCKSTLSTDDLLHMSLPSLEQVLKSSKLTKEDLHDLIFVGSSSHIQKLQPFLEEYLGVKASHVVEPANSHVVGATILARFLFENDDGFHPQCPMLWVSPLSLSIETTGGIMTTIIRRLTPVPVRKSKTFTTAIDNQTTIVIKVYQGERVLARDNILLGKFELSLPPSRRCAPMIDVMLDIDNNSTVRVTAHDLESGINETMIIQAGAAWGNSDLIEYLCMQSEIFYQEDEVLRSLIQNTYAIDGSKSMSG